MESVNKIKIRAIHDRVIVLPEAAPEVTEGGIIIPEKAQQRPGKGVIITVGPGKKDAPTELKDGDTILYSKFAGTEIDYEGQTLLVMREDEVLGVV